MVQEAYNPNNCWFRFSEAFPSAQEYLSNLQEPINFIILDDDNDMGILSSHLIKIDRQVGLTNKNIEDGIKKLKLIKKD